MTKTDAHHVAEWLLSALLYAPISSLADEAGATRAVRSLAGWTGTFDAYCPGCGQTATFRGAVHHEFEKSVSAERLANASIHPAYMYNVIAWTRQIAWARSYWKRLLRRDIGHEGKQMAVFVYNDIGAVETGELPSGDITVRHPINDRLREIVEPICRGRGHWKAEYSNWIIFKQFADAVLSDLEKRGRRIA